MPQQKKKAGRRVNDHKKERKTLRRVHKRGQNCEAIENLPLEKRDDKSDYEARKNG